ncbi:hypothetical protein NDU88_006171 [Pleurodeles waltl]|uniref:Uncharacterized protein n=1 Tax=Pleurodeles waltl TaxID=8319 RepID=A0AAV7PHP6_PLEWA|nr:hypothetical protein NDU88_006171 [Pleurodeles waltl]
MTLRPATELKIVNARGGGQLLRDLSEVEQDLRQIEVHAAARAVSPSQLQQYRICHGEAESALTYRDFRTYMALQHAQGDHSGRLLAWLLRGEHRSTPAMSIRMADDTMATSQLAINDAFHDYY